MDQSCRRILGTRKVILLCMAYFSYIPGLTICIVIVFILFVDIVLIPSRYITRRHQKRNVQTLKAPLVHVIFSLSSWPLG